MHPRQRFRPHVQRFAVQLTSATPCHTHYQRLRASIAKRMRMSPIDQPLMLLELLGR
jgi:hypothetical protein